MGKVEPVQWTISWYAGIYFLDPFNFNDGCGQSVPALRSLRSWTRLRAKTLYIDLVQHKEILTSDIIHLRLENSFILKYNYSIFISIETCGYKTSCLWVIFKIHCGRLRLQAIQLLSSFPHGAIWSNCLHVFQLFRKRWTIFEPFTVVLLYENNC